MNLSGYAWGWTPYESIKSDIHNLKKLNHPNDDLSHATLGDKRRNVVDIEKSAVGLIIKHCFWDAYPFYIHIPKFLFDTIANGALINLIIAYVLIGERPFNIKYYAKIYATIEMQWTPTHVAGLCLLEAYAHENFEVISFYVKLLGNKRKAIECVELVLKDRCIPSCFESKNRKDVIRYIESFEEPTLFDILLQKLKISEVKAFIAT